MPKVLQKSARNCCDEDEDAAEVEEEVEGDNGREGGAVHNLAALRTR